MQHRTTLSLATNCSATPETGRVVGVAGEIVYTHERIFAHRSILYLYRKHGFIGLFVVSVFWGCVTPVFFIILNFLFNKVYFQLTLSFPHYLSIWLVVNFIPHLFLYSHSTFVNL